LGIPGFKLLPDGGFHSDEPVTRAGYARVERGDLTLLTADPSLSTRYVGETSFPDVSGVELTPFWMCTAINSLTNVTDDLG